MKKTTFNNINAIKKGINKSQLIQSLIQKNIKGGAYNCPPPWEVDQV